MSKEQDNNNIPCSISYSYLFNYFGGDTYKGEVVTGASVDLAIRAYKDEREVKFTAEPSCKGHYYNENYSISFNREAECFFTIEKNMNIDNLYRLVYGWDRIEAEVVGYSFDILCEKDEELEKLLPEEVKGKVFYSTCVTVSEQEFKDFLGSHIEDFDIYDNKSAQVPSVMFFDYEVI